MKLSSNMCAGAEGGVCNVRSVLFIAPLPPPTTGQSVACDYLFGSLGEKVNTELVNLSKSSFGQGVDSVGRVWDVLIIYSKILKKCHRADVLYFTISESIAGNLKDLLIYSVCWRRLDRMVIHLHGGAGMREVMSQRHPVLRAVNSFFLKRLGAVIVLGDRLKGIYEGVVPTDKLHAVPNFAKDELFVAPEVIKEKFSEIKPLRLLFLSNLLPGKGHEELLGALSQLPPDVRQRLCVDFAGGFESTEAEVRFRNQVQAIEHTPINVHGLVHGEHKRDLLRKAHVFCLPTYYPYEGQPISILEAYASGCAVITTDHSGIFDTFTPGVNGIEVKPRSHDSIAQAIAHALEHTDELYSYALNNHRQAQLKYRASTHVEKLERIIFSVV